MKRSATLLGLVFALVCAAAFGQPNGMVVMLTDFGPETAAAGAVKGAIYKTFPQVRLDVLSNAIPSFDVMGGAYVLAGTAECFPKGTVFCCIIAPEEKDGLDAVILHTKSGHYFVGPDNGLLRMAADRLGVEEVRRAMNEAYWGVKEPNLVSLGRDLYGPLAANIAKGMSVGEAGPVAEALRPLPLQAAKIVQADPGIQGVAGAVVFVDSFGNFTTNISMDLVAEAGLEQDQVLRVTLGDAAFLAPLKKTYSDVPEGKHLALADSGYLSFAINMGHLADAVDAKPGMALRVFPAE